MSCDVDALIEEANEREQVRLETEMDRQNGWGE